jgi:pSer/pThr/pTyr-binding forkhead associated (FHA) protein
VETDDPPTALDGKPVGGELEVTVDDRRVLVRPGQPFLIGRDPGCQLHLDVAVVSRRHAEVVQTGQGWVLRDLGSSNGTWLDGQRVQTVPVAAGTEVRLGNVADGPLGRRRTVPSS